MAHNQPKILVVDDEPGIRLTLQGIIEDEGFEVVGAGDALEAIELAKETTFDLVFMDIKMPGMHGVDAYREVNRISPGSVVIMMTGFSVDELIHEALEAGAYAVIFKPFEVGQIIDIVNRVLKTTVFLLVDDRASGREVLRAVLEDEGYAVNEASGGNEAISMAAAKHYGIILMDIKMADMDGFTALERIRQFDPQAKAIFISGYTMEEWVIESLLQGAFAVLPKPVDPDELLELIRAFTELQKIR